MKKVLDKRTDIAFFLKLSLIRRNPQIEQKSKSIVCTKSLKSLEEAFEGVAIPVKECETKELEENTRYMEANGLSGVPVTLFPDGSLQVGYVEASVLEARIDEAAARMKGEAGRKKAEGDQKK